MIQTLAGFILYFGFVVNDISVKELRDLYFKSAEDKKSSILLSQRLKTVNQSSPAIYLGYKGMSEFMVCYHAFNPYTKIVHFNKGKDYLDAAIKKDPEDPELRFLRFTVQTNVPLFLGYRDNIENDKKKLLEAVEKKSIKSDRELASKIKEYLLITNHCNEAEKERVRKASAY